MVLSATIGKPAMRTTSVFWQRDIAIQIEAVLYFLRTYSLAIQPPMRVERGDVPWE